MAALRSPDMTFLFSPPRKALATLAVDAARREAMVKSSSFAEAMAMPPMTGMRQRILAKETLDLYAK